MFHVKKSILLPTGLVSARRVTDSTTITMVMPFQVHSRFLPGTLTSPD